MAKTAVIIANGQFPRTEYPRYLIDSSDMKICCDGVLTTLEKHNIIPDVVIGDLDSVCGRALKRFKGQVVKVDEQETNDLTKAFTWLIGNHPEVEDIRIVGATGRREDHTIGNMSLLMEYEKLFSLSARGIKVEMVSDYSTIFAIGGSCTLQVGLGRAISLFTADSSLRIKSQGLQWPLDDVVFDNWWKATLNKASEDTVRLTFSHEAPVLIVLD